MTLGFKVILCIVRPYSNIVRRRSILWRRSKLCSNTVAYCGVKIHEKTFDNECNICYRKFICQSLMSKDCISKAV